jgi:hypothetical protein
MINRFPYRTVMFVPMLGAIATTVVTYRVAVIVAAESGSPSQVGLAAAGVMFVTGGLYLQIAALKIVELVARQQLALEEKRLDVLREQQELKQTPPAAEGWNAMNQEAIAALDPGVVYVPFRPGEWVGLHINIAQLQFIQARIRAKQTNVPYDLCGEHKPFSRPGIIAFRAELVERELAVCTRGKQVVITRDGCAAILRGSPTPMIGR